MAEINDEHVYSIKDLNKAFNMGLENAIFILEKSIGLSPQGQRYLIESLKKKIIEDKISVAMNC